MQKIIHPYTISYSGGISDDHLIKNVDYGYSLIGASKISTAGIHYILSGKIPRRNYRKNFECVTKPPTEGSFEWVQYIIAVTPQLIEYKEPILKGCGFLFEVVWDFLLAKLTNDERFNANEMAKVFMQMKESDNETYLETLRIFAASMDSANKRLADVAEKNAEIGQNIATKLMDDIPELAKEYKNSAINLVQPIGSSCTVINNTFFNGFEVPIDQAQAEVIRSPENDSIGKEETFNCLRVIELHSKNGHCILELEGYENFVDGKIVDPVLVEPGNIYSTALDGHRQVMLTGKPITRDGQLRKIVISNAQWPE